MNMGLSKLKKKSTLLVAQTQSLSRQRDSVVRVGDLITEDPGSNPRLGLLNEFVLGDPRGKFTMLSK